ncbi:nuclear transport factor 2 family protein [Fodinicola acaciae]|uniref:nuclear transport factor 2 family protein n=1 Tax=Fodinicola acaciae TaxID=2681555 RepID=UPI001C9E39B1|nr:nuclear transport factor 2 family protein [Fodinicola acaciae]
MKDIAARYIAVWNEKDADARAKAVADLWTEDGGYTDPLAAVRGPEAIAAVIAGAREQFAGFEFRLVDNVDAHHDTVRFGWQLLPASGTESVVDGFDVLALTEDGRIREAYGFLDKVPAA